MRYYNAIKEKISDQEERLLWIEFTKSGSLEAREKLADKYIHLVKYVINRMLAVSHVESEVLDYDDLYSCGVMGLLAAIDGFDLSRDVKFITYAIPRIKGSIIDELRAVDWIPRSLRQQVNKLQNAFVELENQMLRPANDLELAEKLGVEPAELHELINHASRSALLSLDEVLQISDDGSTTRADITPSRKIEDPRDQIQQEEIVELLTQAIESLPDKERLVVIMYYNDELTLREIGEVLGVTESRVCQLHTKAMLRLRGKLAFWQQDMFV
ncbi:MAG: FliA/WhiG family RNA polymerase sigma factor [Candidatus Omnitrophota bacterium]|jgi:RNA polymerase sigma factor for flagellar operon FliA|nr:MAG: FliA/WhiG family RNA polymerase sigma factor [Candidatus Omnitrophota bacterium]